MPSSRLPAARRAGLTGAPRAYFYLAPLLATGLLAVTLLACAPSGVAQQRPPTALEQSMLAQVNAARSSARVCGDTAFAATGPLRLEGRLSAAAQAHSEDMRAMGTLSHVGSDGSSVVERAERQGYQWSKLAENVAWGYEAVEEVVAGWLSSPGHCRNIMNPDYEELGVGLAGTFWTQVFGTPR